MLQLSSDQDVALCDLLTWLRSPWPERPYFCLQGLAGTGKTTLLGELVRRYHGMVLTAATGKAAAVLRAKVGVPTSTLHSAIYNFRGLVEDEKDPDRMNPIFVPNGERFDGQVILIDESSMIGRRLAQDAISTGARIVACGDPGQLPPVRDAQFFNVPDVTLTHVHRQALDSPIIRQAHAIREGRAYRDDGDGFRVIHRAEPNDLLGHDALLCWRNRTRQRLNSRVRALRGLDGPLEIGEPVMCLKNDHRLGLYNGAIYELLRQLGDDRSLVVRDGEREVQVPLATIEGDPGFEKRRYEDEWLPMAPAYALTVHKAQGSEFGTVLLFDECDDDRARWLYTGVTRARERCTVVSWRKG